MVCGREGCCTYRDISEREMPGKLECCTYIPLRSEMEIKSNWRGGDAYYEIFFFFFSSLSFSIADRETNAYEWKQKARQRSL